MIDTPISAYVPQKANDLRRGITMQLRRILNSERIPKESQRSAHRDVISVLTLEKLDDVLEHLTGF